MQASLQRGEARVKLPVMERTVIVTRAGQGAGQAAGQGAGRGAGQGNGRCIGQRFARVFTRGFAQGFARSFAAQGARMVVVDRRRAPRAAAAMNGGIGQDREVVDPASLDAMTAAVLARVGGIEVLVSNEASSPACWTSSDAVRWRWVSVSSTSRARRC
ncbi:MAG: SDR family oxidoreductase, partial [Rubritepida sp.]|nr:SDR family oxidoreductase [Rubritepida sp.]